LDFRIYVWCRIIKPEVWMTQLLSDIRGTHWATVLQYLAFYSESLKFILIAYNIVSIFLSNFGQGSLI